MNLNVAASIWLRTAESGSAGRDRPAYRFAARFRADSPACRTTAGSNAGGARHALAAGQRVKIHADDRAMGKPALQQRCPRSAHGVQHGIAGSREAVYEVTGQAVGEPGGEGMHRACRGWESRAGVLKPRSPASRLSRRSRPGVLVVGTINATCPDRQPVLRNQLSGLAGSTARRPASRAASRSRWACRRWGSLG